MTRIEQGSPGAIEVVAALARLAAMAQDSGVHDGELDALLGAAPGACAAAAGARAALSGTAEARARRLMCLLAAGAALLGGRDRVGQWLRVPNEALQGMTPLAAMLGDPGALATITRAIVEECREALPGCGL